MPLLINNQFSCSQESWLNQKLVIQSKKKQFATVADPRFLFKTRISSRVRFFVRIIVDETFYRGNRFKWHGTDTQRRTFCVGSSGRQAAKKGRTKRKEQSRPHPWPGSQPSRNRVTLSKAISETEIVVGGVAAVDATTQLKTHRADGRRTDRFRRNFFIKSAATAWKGGGGGKRGVGGRRKEGWVKIPPPPPTQPPINPPHPLFPHRWDPTKGITITMATRALRLDRVLLRSTGFYGFLPDFCLRSCRLRLSGSTVLSGISVSLYL